MKKTIIYIIIGILVAGFIIWRFTRPAKAPTTSYLTTKVVRGDLNVTVTATGQIAPDSDIAVGTQVSGIITNIYVDFNYNVKKGQLLAMIDTVPLKEAINDAKATLAKTQAVVYQTKTAFERTKILLAGKAAAQADYDVAESNYKSAVADQLSAESALDKTITNYKYAFIKAPISGTIVSRNVDIGQTVAAAFSTPTLFMIANNLKKMQVQAAVDETDVGQVFLGQKTVFTVDAYPNLNFYGTVSQIRLQPVVTNNVVDYTIIVETPNDQLKLMPGMTANITFAVTSRKNVLQIPAKALTFNPPGYTPPKSADSAKNKKTVTDTAFNIVINAPASKNGKIWIINGDSLRQANVTLGITNGSVTEVSGDIKEGDRVITGISSSGDPNATAAKSPFSFSMGANQKKKE